MKPTTFDAIFEDGTHCPVTVESRDYQGLIVCPQDWAHNFCIDVLKKRPIRLVEVSSGRA